MQFTIHHKDTASSARTGTVTTAHGSFDTPVFMPVGTKGAVKAITREALGEMGAEIILGNTYHLYLRPGTEVLEHFHGLHNFGGWQRPILTDSGGFQVFSLGKGMRGDGGALAKITEDGVEFRSYMDGSKHFFSPEGVMDIEGSIGGDIMMAFDECAPADAELKYIREALERTHRWAERCVAHFPKMQEQRRERWGDAYYEQTLFPIVQGGIDPAMRKESAAFIAGLDMPGNAIGGLSVGESKPDMYAMMEVVDGVLPRDKPRYLMGVGTPEDLLEGVERGMDMFDCVLPTRIGRHGTFFTHDGPMTISNNRFRLDEAPLDAECEGNASTTYSRAYLRHLFMEKEMVALEILSIHNVRFLLDLMKKARAHIADGTFISWKNAFLTRYLHS